jgi:hypothetical protein
MPIHPLDGAFERINRAEKHFIELNLQVQAFGQNYIEMIRIAFNPDPPYLAQQIHPTRACPGRFESVGFPRVC